MSHRVDDAGDVSEMVGGKWMHRRATGRLKGDNAVIIAQGAFRHGGEGGGGAKQHKRCELRDETQPADHLLLLRPPRGQPTN